MVAWLWSSSFLHLQKLISLKQIHFRNSPRYIFGTFCDISFPLSIENISRLFIKLYLIQLCFWYFLISSTLRVAAGDPRGLGLIKIGDRSSCCFKFQNLSTILIIFFRFSVQYKKVRSVSNIKAFALYKIALKTQNSENKNVHEITKFLVWTSWSIVEMWTRRLPVQHSQHTQLLSGGLEARITLNKEDLSQFKLASLQNVFYIWICIWMPVSLFKIIWEGLK